MSIIKYEPNSLSTRYSLEDLKASVLARLSPNTKRMYSTALTDYVNWSYSEGKRLEYASVNEYIDLLHNEGKGASTINLRLSAIKKLVKEAYMRDWIDGETYTKIQNISGIKAQGKKLGNWLSKQQVEGILNSIPTNTKKGLRDRALLGVMFGAGLRREEVCRLTVNHIQQRDSRWVIVDIKGKGNKTRSIPINHWVKKLLDAWLEVYQGESLFVTVLKGDHVTTKPLTSDAIYKIVQSYMPEIKPHDLRRTFAQLARKNGASIEQIQLSLGHSSIQTTERYLGTSLDLVNAPSDYIKLDIA